MNNKDEKKELNLETNINEEEISENKKANKLCIISYIFLALSIFLPIAFIFFKAIFNIISLTFMIYISIKYPENKSGKILMWVYIIGSIIYFIYFIWVFITGCINTCDTIGRLG